MHLNKLLFLAVTAQLSSFTLAAQVVSGVDSLSNQQLAPVEIRSLRLGSNAPFATTNISGAELQKQNLGHDVPILLQATPSVVTTSDAGAGVGYTGLRVRGVDATRINITLNGIPVNDAEDQGVYFVDIPDLASSTSSIQLERGVGTSTNGAGAFGATMSISTLQQFDSAGAIFSSSYGSFNTMKNTLIAGTGMLKGGWQFDVRLSKVSSDGYIQRSASDLKSLQITAGWKANSKTWFHFMVMAGIEKTGQAWDGVPQDSLKTNRTYNELGLESNGTYYGNQTDNYTQDYYQFFVDHTFSDALSAHVALFLTHGQGYYNEYVIGDQLSNYGLPSFVTPNMDTFSTTDLTRQLWLNNNFYGSVFSLLYKKNKTELSFGGGLTQFEGWHYGYVTWAQYGVPVDYEWYKHADQKNDFNLYLKAQQTLGDANKWILFADMQVRNVAYNINGFQDDPELTPAVNYYFFNPKAGITYLLRNTYKERQKLYASVAVANREPNYEDFEVDPSSLPKPETLYDFEGGYELDKGNWSIGANLYYMRYHDQLVLTGQINDVGQYTETNVPTSYRAGVELQAVVMPTRWLKLSGNFTYSQNKIDNFTEYVDDYDNGGQQMYSYNKTDIAFSPDEVGAAIATFTPFQHLSHGQQFEISLTEKYVGKQYLDNTGSNDRAMQPYSFCNALLRYSFKCRPFKEVDASLLLNNIFSQLYVNNGATYPYYQGGMVNNDNYYFPQAGFNVLGGVTFKW